ncbi:hypothetical protein ACFX13_042768 [Malus domestica]
MVAGQKIACVVDPQMPEKPSAEELKRVLLVALRCVDPDSEHRPRLGEVIHMLELRGLLLCDLRTSIFLSISPNLLIRTLLSAQFLNILCFIFFLCNEKDQWLKRQTSSRSICREESFCKTR